MRLLTRYGWPALFVLVLAHVCVHAARAQCSSGYCPKPAAVYVAPAPAVVVYAAPAPAPVLYYQAAPTCRVATYRVARRPFRLFRRCN
jgi:hypothetical protein